MEILYAPDLFYGYKNRVAHQEFLNSNVLLPWPYQIQAYPI